MFKIYKSLTPIDIYNPPEPIAVDIIDKNFIDTDVVLGDRFYYRVSATKNGIEKFSDQVIGIAGEIDEYFSYVELLIFADADTFPSIVFKDSSSFARIVTYAGGAKIVAPQVFTQKYDDGSINIPGSGGRVDASIIPLGTGDFTIECWAALLTLMRGNSRVLWQLGNNADSIRISVSSDGRLWLEIKTYTFIGLIITSSAIALNNWHHICVIRKNGVFYLFINGSRIGVNGDYIANISTTTFSIGNSTASTSISNSWDGYVSGVRITKNIVRYGLSGFLPPTTKFPQ